MAAVVAVECLIVDKRLVYPTYNVDGRRDVFNISEDRRYLKKVAGVYHPEVQAYIEKAKPIEGLIQVLLTALGDYARWGQNANGDRFEESALNPKGSGDYGYKTFLTNANYFTHHVNKDPALAKGKVLASVWNDKAKRVELVVGINPALDPDASRMLDNGESLCFSMGAKLPYDVCSVCANKARTRAEYCDHLRYQMNQIDPDTGILVGALNPQPKFFDISRVLIPADKTAYMWEKIAGAASAKAPSFAKVASSKLAELPVRQWDKVAAEQAEQAKQATITKRIPATVDHKGTELLRRALLRVKTAIDSNSQSVPEEVLRKMNPRRVILAMTVLGVSPTRAERSVLYELFTGEGAAAGDIKITAADMDIPTIKAISPYLGGRCLYGPAMAERLRDLLGGKEVSIKTASIVGGAARAAGSATVGAAKTGVAITKGVLSALGLVLGVDLTAPKVRFSSEQQGLMGFVAKYPILAGAIGALVARRVLGQPPRPLTSRELAAFPADTLSTGPITLADPTRSFYNTDWQRRFIDMQNRPVAVIKTAAAKEFFDHLVRPMTLLMLAAEVEPGSSEYEGWTKAAAQFLDDLKSTQFQKIAVSAERAGASAGDTTEFLDLELMVAVTELARNIKEV